LEHVKINEGRFRPGIADAAHWVDEPDPSRQEPPMANEGTSPGAVARGLLRAADRAALATSLAGREPVGAEAWPYASLVLLACDHDAAPLLLMSDLAEHSKNIAADPRAALLIDGTAGRTDPLTGPRVTVLGTVEKTEEPRLKARFVARHPSAALYADFADFHLYRVTVTRAHFVAGFGRIHWIEAADLAFDAGAAGLQGRDRPRDTVLRYADAIEQDQQQREAQELSANDQAILDRYFERRLAHMKRTENNDESA